LHGSDDIDDAERRRCLDRRRLRTVAGTDEQATNGRCPAATRRRGQRAKGGGMSESERGGASLDDVDAWLASTQDRAARSAAAARELGALRGIGRDADGVVEVTVTGSGVLIDIALDPQTRSQPAELTRQQILAAIADAQRALTARVAEVATATWGSDSPTTASLIAARTRLVSAPEVDHGNR
jgi:DNA-binding protein YbaB